MTETIISDEIGFIFIALIVGIIIGVFIQAWVEVKRND
jgi:uncharacterized protein YneF (UPF0154 family)